MTNSLRIFSWVRSLLSCLSMGSTAKGRISPFCLFGGLPYKLGLINKNLFVEPHPSSS
jgi:hypothetical protein